MNKDELLNIKEQLQKVCDSRRGCFSCELYWRAKGINENYTTEALSSTCVLIQVQRWLGELAEKAKGVEND